MTPDQVVEKLAEERSDVILRHQREWREWDEEFYEEAKRIFHEPDKIVHRTYDSEGNVTSERLIDDYTRIDKAKTLAQSLAIRQKAERIAHSLDHNMNTTKAQDIVARDQMVEETFKAIRDAALDVRRRGEEADKTIDITPNKES
jgi:uncharacterized protein YdeI (YjbR/CyaY-like superfamily)